MAKERGSCLAQHKDTAIDAGPFEQRPRPVAPGRTVPSRSANTRSTADTQEVLLSSALLGPRQAIEIEHNGQRYRLQSTKSGKLILTK